MSKNGDFQLNDKLIKQMTSSPTNRGINMTNRIEHKIPAKITNLTHVQSPDYRIVGVVGSGVTDYYPSIGKDGKPMSVADYSIEEMLAAKVHRQRLTVRLEVVGNAVSAEGYIRQVTGYDAMAISQDHVDVYVPAITKY